MNKTTDGFKSSVQPSESKPRPAPHSLYPTLLHAQTPAETFRHSGWAYDRHLVHEALHRTSQSISRIVSFGSCGYKSYVVQHPDDPNTYRLVGSSCHDRFCRPCARLRAQVVANNLYDHTERRQTRFVTLTLKHASRFLKPELDRLYRSFARLRRTQFWMDHVKGGAAFCEVKFSERSQSWHPHLHCLVEGRYIPHELLRNHWYNVTGDSTVVDVRPVPDRQAVIKYVTKYVAKGLGQTYVNRPKLLDECILAMVGRRLCTTFGSWRGVSLTDNNPETTWVHIGPFDAILYAAIDGDAVSKSILRDMGVDPAKALLLDDRGPPAERVTVRHNAPAVPTLFGVIDHRF